MCVEDIVPEQLFHTESLFILISGITETKLQLKKSSHGL